MCVNFPPTVPLSLGFRVESEICRVRHEPFYSDEPPPCPSDRPTLSVSRPWLKSSLTFQLFFLFGCTSLICIFVPTEGSAPGKSRGYPRGLELFHRVYTGGTYGRCGPSKDEDSDKDD